MSSSIVLLPAEVHGLILQALDRESLFKLRLTCKTLNHRATPPVFKRLHVWLEEESLQKLVNIANEPHLHNHVNFIDFGMDLFYDIGGEYFKKYIFSQFSNHHDILELAWCVYRIYYLKQNILRRTNGDLAMFAHAIAAFSALECIRLVDFQSHVNGSNEGPKLLERETLLRQDILNAASIRPPMPLGSHQLRILIRALATSGGIKLQNLYLQLYTVDLNKQGFYSTLSAKDADLAKSAFCALKTLTLSLPPVCHTLIEEWEETSTESSISTVLKAATELEDLELEFPPTRTSTTARPASYWKHIIQTTCFGKLKRLSIKGAILDEDQFASFLIQSCQRLKRLELSDAVVAESSWDLIFEAIRSLPELVDLAFEDLGCKAHRFAFLEPHGSKWNPKPLYDYLLKRRSDHPWRSKCPVRQAHVAEQFRMLMTGLDTDV